MEMSNARMSMYVLTSTSLDARHERIPGIDVVAVRVDVEYERRTIDRAACNEHFDWICILFVCSLIYRI